MSDDRITAPRRGLLAPLKRDRKRDFASGTGLDLLVSKVVQVLATAGDTPRSTGELPWRTSFGAGLHLLRHRNNDTATRELVRVQVRDALRRFVPSAVVTLLDVSRDGPTLMIRLRVAERPDGPTRDVEVLA